MFYQHGLNPIALDIMGFFSIRWYGVMYVLGFTCAYFLGRVLLKKNRLMTEAQFVDLLSVMALAVLLGGRLGYVLVYKFHAWVLDPWLLLRFREGGMAFHGALLAGIAAALFFARYHRIDRVRLLDFIVLLLPPGLFFGRWGNFINGELWGRPTDQTWGVLFPQADELWRHPSQLYEMLGEGLVLGLALWMLRWRMNQHGDQPGLLSRSFLWGYASIRFWIEFYREPDYDLGFISMGLSMGQWLCLIMMILTGLWSYCCKQSLWRSSNAELNKCFDTV